MDIAALEVLVIELVSGNFQIRCCFKLDESDSVSVMSIKRSGERTPTLCHPDHGQLRSRPHPVPSAERNLSDPKIPVSRRPPVERIPKAPTTSKNDREAAPRQTEKRRTCSISEGLLLPSKTKGSHRRGAQRGVAPTHQSLNKAPDRRSKPSYQT